MQETNSLVIELPRFKDLSVAERGHDIERLIEDNRASLETLLANQRHYSWRETLQPLEDLNDRLNKAWSPLSHLHGVADSTEIRQTYNEVLPKLSSYHTDLMQHQDLYAAYRAVAASREFARLGAAERRIVNNALRDFRLSGADLPEHQRAQFKALKEQLSRLQTKFEENLLDATQGWFKHIEDQQQLSGLPESALALAKQAAEQRGLTGWVFTLDFPSYQPLISFADDRDLRYEMYYAFTTRASDQGPHNRQFDNSTVMEEILACRQRLAGLLGFNNYAEYSLATKMADNPEQVTGFLNDLAARSTPTARQEYAELVEFASKQLGIADLTAWDFGYASEKLRQQRYAISQETLRPYFPAEHVLAGLFAVVGRLFGLKVTAREGVDTWHRDVRVYDVNDSDGLLRGLFYLDLYARANKRGGAWMDECVVRKARNGHVQVPIAYLTCNFSPPVGDQPALLTHTEVITLFHEFGHGLHHMLTVIDQLSVAGINGVPWDAVELPSQLMENWCWEYEALQLLSAHVEDGRAIERELFERLQAAKNFQSGMQMMRQLEFALFDFRLHMEDQTMTNAEIKDLLTDIRKQVAVFEPPDFNRFQHGFSHIFAGGYSAGYYSYKWAELLSADAYSKFEERGVFDRITGTEFLHSVLEQGGAREPMELFVEFRGREPRIEPLLRHSGISIEPDEAVA
jgi:oligopeptidase A